MIYWHVFTAAFLVLLFLNTLPSSPVRKVYGTVSIMFLVSILSGMITGVFWLLEIIGLFGGV